MLWSIQTQFARKNPAAVLNRNPVGTMFVDGWPFHSKILVERIKTYLVE